MCVATDSTKVASSFGSALSRAGQGFLMPSNNPHSSYVDRSLSFADTHKQEAQRPSKRGALRQKKKHINNMYGGRRGKGGAGGAVYGGKVRRSRVGGAGVGRKGLSNSAKKKSGSCTRGSSTAVGTGGHLSVSALRSLLGGSSKSLGLQSDACVPGTPGVLARAQASARKDAQAAADMYSSDEDGDLEDVYHQFPG